MHYFRGEVTPSPLEELLNKWDAAVKDKPPLPSPSAENPTPPLPPVSSAASSTVAGGGDGSGGGRGRVDAPSLDQFLAEEDILRECRSENARLIAYMCQPLVVRELVYKALAVPAAIAEGHVPELESAAAAAVAPPSPVPPGFPTPVGGGGVDELRERQLNFAVLAAELLAADNKLIAEAVLEQGEVLDQVFAAVQQVEGGKLDAVVALHFAKVVICLLKMHNARTIEEIAKRGTPLIQGILAHMDSAPIADLVVKMLDGPEPEQVYGVQPIRKPANEALEMLAKADILGGLAECFVKAASDTVDLRDEDAQVLVENAVVKGEGESVEERAARQRRFREETMANVVTTILGLTERVLQMPDFGCIIPPKLSPYSTPSVVSRLLDAGLFASCNGNVEKKAPMDEKNDASASEQRVQAFSSRCNSALLHSLGLAADLMTTEANIVHDDEEEAAATAGHPGGGRYGGGVGRAPYHGRGIAPSFAAREESKEEGAAERQEMSPEELRMLQEHASKKAGDLIADTTELEAELAVRFPRLSGMFGESDLPAAPDELQPLGSLRLKLAEFFVACMKTAQRETVDLMIELAVPKMLLQLFSKYQWSSMLHGVITNSIVAALDGQDLGRPARAAWFGAGLVPWLIDSWTQNVKEEEKNPKKRRAGYMGHLIRIGTALKGYLDENEKEELADLPDTPQVEAFGLFAEQTLAPAHNLESTPLCGEQVEGSDGEEGEEATDVLEMGGLSFVENPDNNSSGDTPLLVTYGVGTNGDIVDEDEEIQAVEVDDLDHFGGDDDEVREVKPLPDHDIPADLREQLAMKEESTSVKQIAEELPLRREDEQSNRTIPDAPKSAYIPMPSPSNEQLEELKGVIDNVDSSSDDEGSYIAFVDDQKDSEDSEASKVSDELKNLRVSESDNGTSLDGIVTEIEEPGPFTPVGDVLQSVASNVVASVPDDAGDSSDEEYEAWEDPARVETPVESEAMEGASAVEPQKREDRTGRIA